MKRYKLISLIVVYILIFASCLGCIFASFSVHNINFKADNKANKIILFIGDGMGFNHLKVYEKYYNKQLSFTNFPVVKEVKTHSKSLFSPTDSAASASAMATGIKYNNKEIAYHNGKEIPTILDYYKQNGYGTGVVTTDVLSGATPASFTSHSENRKNTKEIIDKQIYSNVDLLCGFCNLYYQEQFQNFEKENYEIITDISKYPTSAKVLANFEYSSNSFELHTPTLLEMTKYSIAFMEKNFPEGYILMIEGAHIDKMSHDNNIYEMLYYLNDFNDSISFALELNQFTILVTADHETGGLRVSNNISCDDFTKTHHTSLNVGLFINGNHFLNKELLNKLPPILDNTDIYYLLKGLI